MIVFLLLLTSACSSSTDDEVARDCTIEIVLDDDGNTVERTICVGGVDPDESADPTTTTSPATPTPRVLDKTLARLNDSPEVAADLRALDSAIARSEDACDDPVDWARTVPELVSTLDAATESTTSLKTILGPADTQTLTGELADRALLINSSCASPWTRGETSDDDPRRSLVAALDRWSAPAFTILASPITAMWSVEEFRTLWLTDARRREGREDEIWIMGSSVGIEGISDTDIEAQLDVGTLNASVNGGFAETIPAWIDEIGPTNESTIVWAITPQELFTSCQVEERRAGFADRSRRRQAAFPPVDADETLPLDHLLDPAPVSAGSPVWSQVIERFGPSLTGWTPERRDGAVIRAAQLDLFAPDLVAGEPCRARIDSLLMTVEDLVDSGFRLVVALLPVHTDFMGLHPDGAAAVNAVADEALVDTAARGAETLDLRARLGDDHMFDITHLNEEGRVLASRFIADHIESNE